MKEGTFAVPTESTHHRMLRTSHIHWKMLGALAIGATFGALIGLPCGQGGSMVGSLREIAQALIAIAAPTSLAFGLPGELTSKTRLTAGSIQL